MRFDIENHLEAFPNVAHENKKGRHYFWWFIGNTYKRKVGYYGEFPPSLLERIRSLFPEANPILHLFSGTIESAPGEWTIDINEELNPDICCRAEEVSDYFNEDFFELVIADPPYSKRHAEEYSCKMPNTAQVMRELHKIVVPGGIVAWVTTHPPLYRKEQWKLAGIAVLHSGTNRVLRGVVFMEKI